MPTAQELLDKFGTVKTLPHVALRLTKLISNEKTSIVEFERVIKADPTLVLRLLHVVNSPFFGLRQKVDNISRAVVFVGMKNLRNLVVTTALKSVYKESHPVKFFSRSILWLHSAAVSICGQMISERIFNRAGDDVYLCGILHDIGMIVEDQVVQDLFLETCKTNRSNTKSFIEHEREVIGADHCEIGHLLACDWNLPVDVQEGILLHHNTDQKISPDSTAGIIQTADYMVCKLNYPAIPEVTPILSKDLAMYLKDNIGEYKALAKDLPDEMEKAKELHEQKGD
ncbi:MAG: HDOD domain-containing protein [Deltaproteobacteria bacterium]|nr:HDOD domain-containing protein [Deltaproteobacteria bacterium]MBW1861515.1 HDOD domain-containing protein [Deltaproteobacteria bacterium]